MRYTIIRKGVNVTKEHVIKTLENVSIVLGVSISLASIETILGIIILCFQIILILYKFISKVVEHCKNKNFIEIEQDIKDAKDELEDLRNDNK